MSAFAHSLRGVIAIVASQFAFLLNDTLVKLVSDALPLGQIIFLRGLFAAALLAPLAIATGLHRSLPHLWHRMVSWRVVGELGGTLFYLSALIHMPLANATIIFQAVPLTVTGGAALFLREAVGWRRWTAIVIGFVGVVMVVRPGLSGFDPYGLLVLASVLFVSMRDLTTRAMPAVTPTLLVTLATAVAVAIMGALLGLTEDWVRPSVTHSIQLAGAAIFLSIGYATSILAMRLGEMSVTAPFRYVAVVIAIALGFVVWRDVPDAMTVLGSAVIVSAGLYTLYREQRTKNSRAALAAASPEARTPM